MRISDMELREVAARLRSYIPDRSCMISTAEAIGAFDADTIGNRVFFDYVLRIADLIDPTCRNVSGCKDTFECSKCRCKAELITEVCNEHGEPLHVPLMPSYCPNCRARVVRGDE